MSPVQQTKVTSRNVFVLAVSLMVAALGLLVMVLVAVPKLGESGKIETKLGDDRFDAGFDETQAASIERDGPILYPDVANGQRDIIVQHLGTDPATGWKVFDARRPGQPRECYLAWKADRHAFEDPCDHSLVPADGEGMVQYPVQVTDKGKVLVDLNADRRRAGTTSTSLAVTGSVP